MEKILGNPNEYKPMPILEAIPMLIQQKRKENLEHSQKAEEMMTRVTLFSNLNNEKESIISMIPSDDFRTKYCTRKIGSAQKEVVWYTPIERIPATVTYYNDIWRKVYPRGVKHRVIAEIDNPSSNVLEFIDNYKKENPGFLIRFAKSNLLIHFGLFDETDMIFSINKMKGIADSQMLSTNNNSLISVFKDYFELRWKSAMKEYPKKRIDKDSV